MEILPSPDLTVSRSHGLPELADPLSSNSSATNLATTEWINMAGYSIQGEK
jgi:hypothetical protein